jgi:hypothetical protein
VTVIKPGPEGVIFGRGDYGCEYASDVIAIIEQFNCVKGCARAGDLVGPALGGSPGGSCDILDRIWSEEPVPEIDPRDEGPVCKVRQPLEEVSS